METATLVAIELKLLFVVLPIIVGATSFALWILGDNE
jgi:hypothetical protein